MSQLLLDLEDLEDSKYKSVFDIEDETKKEFINFIENKILEKVNDKINSKIDKLNNIINLQNNEINNLKLWNEKLSIYVGYIYKYEKRFNYTFREDIHLKINDKSLYLYDGALELEFIFDLNAFNILDMNNLKSLYFSSSKIYVSEDMHISLSEHMNKISFLIKGETHRIPFGIIGFFVLINMKKQVYLKNYYYTVSLLFSEKNPEFYKFKVFKCSSDLNVPTIDDEIYKFKIFTYSGNKHDSKEQTNLDFVLKNEKFIKLKQILIDNKFL